MKIMQIFLRVYSILKKKIKRYGNESQISNMSFRKRGKKIHIGYKTGFITPQNIIFHDNISLGNNCLIDGTGGLEIESNVISSSDLTILTSSHNFKEPNALPYGTDYITKPVHIGKNVWFGMRVIILPGVKIGEGAVIGAGSIVTKEIPPLAIVGGNPAIIIGYRDKEKYEKAKKNNILLSSIRNNLRCKNCKLDRLTRDCMKCWISEKSDK